MAVRDRLQALKKLPTNLTKTYETENLIVGEDIYALELLYRMKSENIATMLLSKVQVDLDDLVLRNPCGLRGAENVELFREMYPEIHLEEMKNENLFFKDSKWREFGGRSKPEKLLTPEVFFTQKTVVGDWAKAFSILQNKDPELLSDALVLYPSKIEFLDGVWNVMLSNNSVIKTKNLIWGYNPDEFTKLFEMTGMAYDQLLEYTDSTKTSACLYFKAIVPNFTCFERETLFMPQSLTYDLGHYIAQFEKLDNGEKLEVISFVDLELVSEDDLAKRIKATKKNLEKVYPNFPKKLEGEKIKFIRHTPSTAIFDGGYNFVREQFAGLFFVGENGAVVVDPEYKQVSHMARGLKSIEQILNNLKG